MGEPGNEFLWKHSRKVRKQQDLSEFGLQGGRTLVVTGAEALELSLNSCCWSVTDIKNWASQLGCCCNSWMNQEVKTSEILSLEWMRYISMWKLHKISVRFFWYPQTSWWISGNKLQLDGSVASLITLKFDSKSASGKSEAFQAEQNQTRNNNNNNNMLTTLSHSFTFFFYCMKSTDAHLHGQKDRHYITLLPVCTFQCSWLLQCLI